MLGAPAAGRLLKHFDQPDLEVLARAAAGLDAVSPAALERLVEAFTADFSAGSNLLGGAAEARNLLAEALPPEEVEVLLGSRYGRRPGDRRLAGARQRPREMRSSPS